MKTKILSKDNRPWAMTRAYSCFFGTYRLHGSGIWLPAEMSISAGDRLGRAFELLPGCLRDSAVKFELTISLSALPWTRAENSSTIYGDWYSRNPALISPHLEMGSKSFNQLLLPHLAHELGHLFWRTENRDGCSCFEEFLLSSTSWLDCEITPYAQEKFSEYVRYVSQVDTSRSPEHREKVAGIYRQCWVEESFCETVAALISRRQSLSYPLEPWCTSVDIRRRASRIEEFFALSLT